MNMRTYIWLTAFTALCAGSVGAHWASALQAAAPQTLPRSQSATTPAAVTPAAATPEQMGAPEQTASPATVAVPVSSTGPVNTGFVLGAGDQIVLHVVDLEDISERPLQIDPDGGVDLPLVGRMQASGLTVSEFKAALSSRLSKYITDPQISVNVTSGTSRSVSVVGEVTSPGVHALPGPTTLLEVISLAGGIKTDAGYQVIVTREMKYGLIPLPTARPDVSGKFSTATLSLDDLMASKSPGNNILLDPGDVISIPKGDIVYVIGDVKRAGGFPLSSHSAMTLLQALSLAEGLGPDAASQRAKILRPVADSEGKSSGAKPLEIPVNVKSIFEGKAPDVPVYANDIVFIPNSSAKSGTRRAIEAVLTVATGVAIYR